jgi:hypothetical protein
MAEPLYGAERHIWRGGKLRRPKEPGKGKKSRFGSGLALFGAVRFGYAEYWLPSWVYDRAGRGALRDSRCPQAQSTASNARQRRLGW